MARKKVYGVSGTCFQLVLDNAGVEGEDEKMFHIGIWAVCAMFFLTVGYRCATERKTEQETMSDSKLFVPSRILQMLQPDSKDISDQKFCGI